MGGAASRQRVVHASSQRSPLPQVVSGRFGLCSLLHSSVVYSWSDPCNFRAEWVVRITKWHLSTYNWVDFVVYQLSMPLGSSSLLTGRGTGLDQWVPAAPGYIFHGCSHGFSYLEGTLELFCLKGVKVSLFLGLEMSLPYISSNALNFNLPPRANHMQSRTIRSNSTQFSWVFWHPLA